MTLLEPTIPIDPVARIYAQIEHDILMNVGRELGSHSRLLAEDIESWRLVQLQKIGELSQDNLLILSKYSGKSVRELTKLLEEVGYSTIRDTDKLLEQAVKQGAVLYPAANDRGTTERILSAFVGNARNTMNLSNATLLQTFENEFREVLDQSVAKVLTGSRTPQQALRETARGWANKGLTGYISPKDGRKYSIEGYIAGVIRTSSNGISNEMQFARMDEYDVDLLEVSSHAGARPKCAPYQGRIFSRSGRSRKYASLASTSYGEIDGLKGRNCRHIFYPFVEGVSIRRPSQVERAENDRIYKESQVQRKLERDIRKSKQEMNMMEAMRDDEGVQMARQKVLSRQANMRMFIDETGRTRRRNREQSA